MDSSTTFKFGELLQTTARELLRERKSRERAFSRKGKTLPKSVCGERKTAMTCDEVRVFFGRSLQEG